MQGHLTLIPHEVQGEMIYQRPADGYINATAMCRAAGKMWGHYNEARATKEFLNELATDIGIPISELIQSVRGGLPEYQGTWVHPQVSTHLAQWLSPRFAVMVSKWVVEWMSGGGPARKAELPYHLRRHIANQNNVPVGHFSILSEMIIALIGPMETMGYTLPESMMPDISLGRMFCQWLRLGHGIDTKQLPTYWHIFEDGRRVQAKAYPEHLLGDFRRHLREVWLQKHAIPYFRPRDSKALEYLPRLIAGPPRAA